MYVLRYKIKLFSTTEHLIHVLYNLHLTTSLNMHTILPWQKHHGRYHSVEEMLDNQSEHLGLGYFRFMVINDGSTYHMLKNSSAALHKVRYV